MSTVVGPITAAPGEASGRTPIVRAPQAGRIGCIHCDAMVTVGSLRGGLRAVCPRCGNVLSSRPKNALERAMAFAVSAAALLVLALAFPFLAIHQGGIENVMTLPSAAVTLYRDGYVVLGILVLGLIIGVPAIMLSTLLAVLVPLTRRVATPWLESAARLTFGLGPWSMVEVFIIGVIVSLVKLASMATVVLGLSFWSYVGFSICFTAAMSCLDRVDIWRRIEALGK